jgi:hypothetical protein
MKNQIWTIRTDDIDTIKRLAMGGNLLTLKLTFSLWKWRFVYVGTYLPYK